MAKRDARAVTQADVARLAGVSTMTVSKVLRGTGSISETTQAQVRTACEELGYVANVLAGSLSSQKSSIIGVIIPSSSDIVFSALLTGINDVTRPEGLFNLIGETHFDPEIEYQLVEMMMSLQPIGLIMTSGRATLEKTERLLSRRRCPLLMIWDAEDDTGDGCVGLSHAAAGREIAKHFCEEGFKNIAFIGAELAIDLCAAKRMAAFKDHITATGRSIIEEVDENLPRQASSGRVLTERLLNKHPQVDAIYYLNDAMATGGLSWMLNNREASYKKIAVAAFNGTARDYSIRTKITTIDVPRREIGREAGRLLLRLTGDEQVENARKIINGRFERGNTT